MARCFDCDSIKMFCDPQVSDGKCSVCHGTGFTAFVDSLEIEFLNGASTGWDYPTGWGSPNGAHLVNWIKKHL
jgi:hypothetical protein